MIREFMTTKLVTVKEDEPLIVILEKMMNNRLSGLPVVDDEGCLVGFVPNSNILDNILPEFFKEISISPGILHGLKFTDYIRKQEGFLSPLLAKDLMVKPSYVLNEKSSFVEAIKVFLEKKINRIGIVDDEGVLIGVLCRNNVLTALHDYLVK